MFFDGNVLLSDCEDMDVFFGLNGKKVGRSKFGIMDMVCLLKEDNLGDYEIMLSLGSGKKKGKKGKKVVDLLLFGFSVISNCIMMGEIYYIDD